jgi:hypothetical protein
MLRRQPLSKWAYLFLTICIGRIARLETPIFVLTAITLSQGGYLSIWEWLSTSSASNLTLWMQRLLCSCVGGNHQDELSRFQNVGADEKSKYSTHRWFSSGHL